MALASERVGAAVLIPNSGTERLKSSRRTRRRHAPDWAADS